MVVCANVFVFNGIVSFYFSHPVNSFRIEKGIFASFSTKRLIMRRRTIIMNFHRATDVKSLVRSCVSEISSKKLFTDSCSAQIPVDVDFRNFRWISSAHRQRKREWIHRIMPKGTQRFRHKIKFHSVLIIKSIFFCVSQVLLELIAGSHIMCLCIRHTPLIISNVIQSDEFILVGPQRLNIEKWTLFMYGWNEWTRKEDEEETNW